MKKGVMNYSITWNESGRKNEKIFFTKFETISEYITILKSCNTAISELKIWEIYRSLKPAEDITSRINQFLYN